MSAALKYMHSTLAMFLIAALFYPAQSFCQTNEYKVFANADTAYIKIGEPVTLTIGATISNLSTALEWPELGDTITAKIEIIQRESADTQSMNNVFTITQKIKITSFDTGYHVIPPLPFKVNEQTMETDPILLTVQTVKVDTTQGFKDIAEIYTPPFSLSEWIKTNWKWIALVGILITGAVIFYIVYIKNKNKVQVVPKPKPKLPAYVIALKRLDDLQAQKLWQANQLKEYYSLLSEILREYIDNNYHINALEKTTDEIMEILKRDGLDNNSKQLLFRVLFRADMVKFAKEKPLPDENEASIKYAIKFVEQTKPQGIETTNAVLEN